MDRKIDTTAEGSVVETIAPTRRHATRPTPETSASDPPTTTVEKITATTASVTIGTQSSSIRLRFIPSVTWKSSVGRKT